MIRAASFIETLDRVRISVKVSPLFIVIWLLINLGIFIIGKSIFSMGLFSFGVVDNLGSTAKGSWYSSIIGLRFVNQIGDTITVTIIIKNNCGDLTIWFLRELISDTLGFSINFI